MAIEASSYRTGHSLVTDGKWVRCSICCKRRGAAFSRWGNVPCCSGGMPALGKRKVPADVTTPTNADDLTVADADYSSGSSTGWGATIGEVIDVIGASVRRACFDEDEDFFGSNQQEVDLEAIS